MSKLTKYVEACKRADKKRPRPLTLPTDVDTLLFSTFNPDGSLSIRESPTEPGNGCEQEIIYSKKQVSIFAEWLIEALGE